MLGVAPGASVFGGMSDRVSPPKPLSDLSVSPLVAVALLEALRSADTPRDRLEDEDLQQSLPRRLGLSKAVAAEIRRYNRLLDGGEAISGEEAGDLLTLVARRADAVQVFEEAGRWLARRRLESSLSGRLAWAPLPSAVRNRLALRTARWVARLVTPGSSIETETSPPALTVEVNLPAAVTESPDGCGIIRAALDAAFGAHQRGRDQSFRGEVVHPLCEARGDGCCLWRAATDA